MFLNGHCCLHFSAFTHTLLIARLWTYSWSVSLSRNSAPSTMMTRKDWNTYTQWVFEAMEFSLTNKLSGLVLVVGSNFRRKCLTVQPRLISNLCVILLPLDSLWPLGFWDCRYGGHQIHPTTRWFSKPVPFKTILRLCFCQPEPYQEVKKKCRWVHLITVQFLCWEITVAHLSWSIYKWFKKLKTSHSILGLYGAAVGKGSCL